ncbi:uroporphyrinogen-III synthase [Alphaproteobacteria bacterium]|nr:uroporphyrinogen-III synthase [Alphaproteobacteria bacterium]
MKILLTRPIEDSQRIANDLRELNINSVISPLLEIHRKRDEEIDYKKYQSVLITSKNAAFGLCDSAIKKSLPIYCVGDATSSFIESLGFSNVISASGDVSDLIRVTAANLNPSNGPIVHLSGQHVRHNIKKELEYLHFEVDVSVIYEAKEVKSFNADILKSLEKKEITGVFLYSPRSARIFIDNMKRIKLTAAAQYLKVYCISLAVADELKELKWKKVLIAEKPDNAEMLALVREK